MATTTKNPTKKKKKMMTTTITTKTMMCLNLRKMKNLMITSDATYDDVGELSYQRMSTSRPRQEFYILYDRPGRCFYYTIKG